MKALILCAGKGERLKPLTDTTPKPMVPINGKPVLEYLINLCKANGIFDIAINTSYLPEKIIDYFGNGEKFGVNLKFSFEPELLGTSGALNNFRDFFADSSFVVIYGDTVTNIDLRKMIRYHEEKGGIATIALRKKPFEYKTQSLIIADNNLRITTFLEKPSDEEIKKFTSDFKLINSGIYVLSPKILDFIAPGFSDFGYDIFPKLIKQGEKEYGFMMDDYYFREIGKLDKYELAKKEIESGNFNLNLRNKAIFLDRDGVINENIYEVDGKIMAPATLDQLKILPDVKEGIREFKKMGFKVIVVTNQPGIAFGYLDVKKLEEINNFLKKQLEIDEIYFCPHHEKYNSCDCRKPSIGLLLKAKKDFNLDIDNSFMIGDSLSDIQTGINAKVRKTLLIGVVREDILEIQHKKNIFPDFIVKNLVEAANLIKKL